jgi:hypothetical protein
MLVSKFAEDMIDQRDWYVTALPQTSAQSVLLPLLSRLSSLINLLRMQPDDPSVLCRRVVEHLAGQRPSTQNSKSIPSTVCDGISRDIWIDYLADCGDCSICSDVVARLVFADYSLTDAVTGRDVVAPRGDVLMFGGDTACE